MSTQCEKCDGLGYVCAKCGEADRNCRCPYGLNEGGKKPGVVACPKCRQEKAK